MKWNVILGTVVLGLGLSTESYGFELLDRMLGISSGCNCGCVTKCGCNNGCAAGCAAVVFAGSLGVTHIPHLWAVCLGLCSVCLGFFSVHSAAVGNMNRRLHSNRGLANSLYVLLYYLGGSAGITVCGYAYQNFGWRGVTGVGMILLLNILAIGLVEIKRAEPATGN